MLKPRFTRVSSDGSTTAILKNSFVCVSDELRQAKAVRNVRKPNSSVPANSPGIYRNADFS